MRTDGVRALGVDVTHGNCWITLVHVWENQIVCGRFKSKKEGIRWIITRSWIHQTNCFQREPKFYYVRPIQEAKFPLPYSLNFLTVTDCYLMIISVARKKIFNSILPVLKSISLREIIASFKALFPSDISLFKFYFAIVFGGGGGRGLQSNHDISLNVFVRSKPIFVCRICELINTWIHLRFSCHKEPEQSSRVQLSETSICRWLLVLLRSFWFPCKSPQAAQEWNREGLEGKKAAISIAL